MKTLGCTRHSHSTLSTPLDSDDDDDDDDGDDDDDDDDDGRIVCDDDGNDDSDDSDDSDDDDDADDADDDDDDDDDDSSDCAAWVSAVWSAFFVWRDPRTTTTRVVGCTRGIDYPVRIRKDWNRIGRRGEKKGR